MGLFQFFPGVVVVRLAGDNQPDAMAARDSSDILNGFRESSCRLLGDVEQHIRVRGAAPVSE